MTTSELAARVLKAAQIRAVLLDMEIPDAAGVFYMSSGWRCSVPEVEAPAFPDEDAALRWAFAEYVKQIDALKAAKQQEIDEIKAILDQARDLRRGEG